MTTASQLLEALIGVSAAKAPSVTVAQLQPSSAPIGTFGKGIGMYGWAVNGATIQIGATSALRFSDTHIYYSDRAGAGGDAAPFEQGFGVHSADRWSMTLAPSGDEVSFTVETFPWQTTFSATSLAVAGELILFDIPGAGLSAPRAGLLVTLHASGSVGFL